MSASARRLDEWSCAATAPAEVEHPRALEDADLDWLPLTAPGTAAAALRQAGRWTLGSELDLDASDWWFRCSFEAPSSAEPHVLVFEGLATLADVWLNAEHVLTSANMHRVHEIDVPDSLPTHNELVIRCRALCDAPTPKRPRARWKTRLVRDQGLRWHRTTLLGRMPSLRPWAAPVGPWRPVVLRARAGVELAERRLTSRMDGADGRVDLRARVVSGEEVLEAILVVGGERTPLDLRVEGADHWIVGATTVPAPARWWPATHGDQPRYPVSVECRTTSGWTSTPLGSTGFRSLTFGPEDRPGVVVNGVPVFARGACWSPIDPVGLAPSPEELRAALTQVREAGMNMLRVTGTGVYESDDFLDACDELGLLVWHDLMFANMDYPADDEAFVAEVRHELDDVLVRLQARPCVAAIAGGSEISQQAAMLGRQLESPAVGLHDVLRDAVADHLPECRFWTDSPSIGTHPFTADTGIAHYFGVGGYRRPLTDARFAGVRFASECLAISNVPSRAAVEDLLAGGGAVHDARWKAGVFRDNGPSWDFEDVRDHYVSELYGVDPVEVRFGDPERYLDLGRAASAEVMRRTLAEWRRPASTCNGALILFLRDLIPGAGIGILDSDGRPKSPFHPLRRTLAPVALLLSDEGVNGLALTALNDTDQAIDGTISVQAYAGVHRVADGAIPISVGPHGAWEGNAEAVLGTFLDVTYAFRFGPISVDAIAVQWHADGAVLGRGVHHPVSGALSRTDVGLSGVARALDEGRYAVEIRSERLALAVMLDGPGVQVTDDVFDIEPGGCVHLEALSDEPLRLRARALNGLETVLVDLEQR